MDDIPLNGRIVIEWERVSAPPPDDFDWRVKLEPPGLTDEDVSRLLAEIAKRV
jgi:hypothetical protein